MNCSNRKARLAARESLRFCLRIFMYSSLFSSILWRRYCFFHWDLEIPGGGGGMTVILLGFAGLSFCSASTSSGLLVCSLVGGMELDSGSSMEVGVSCGDIISFFFFPLMENIYLCSCYTAVLISRLTIVKV